MLRSTFVLRSGCEGHPPVLKIKVVMSKVVFSGLLTQDSWIRDGPSTMPALELISRSSTFSFWHTSRCRLKCPFTLWNTEKSTKIVHLMRWAIQRKSDATSDAKLLWKLWLCLGRPSLEEHQQTPTSECSIPYLDHQNFYPNRFYLAQALVHFPNIILPEFLCSVAAFCMSLL